MTLILIFYLHNNCFHRERFVLLENTRLRIEKNEIFNFQLLFGGSSDGKVYLASTYLNVLSLLPSQRGKKNEKSLEFQPIARDPERAQQEC